jgi:hypothetical protein
MDTDWPFRMSLNVVRSGVSEFETSLMIRSSNKGRESKGFRERW